MNALWLVSSVVTLAAAGLMCLTDGWRRWPSLFLWLCLILAESATCRLLVNSHSYFWAYYAFTVALDVCEVWLLAQIAVAMAGITPWLKRSIAGSVWRGSLILFLGCGVLSFSEAMPAANRLLWVASRYDTAVSLALFIALAAVLGLAGAAKVELPKQVRPIAAGMFLEVLSTLLASLLYVYYPKVTSLTVLKGCAYCFAALLLVSPFLRKPSTLLASKRELQLCVSKRSMGQC